jgi:alcohol dehydrogenase
VSPAPDSGGPGHRIAFTGSIWFGTLPRADRLALALVDSRRRFPGLEARVLGSDVVTVECEGRPGKRLVGELAERARSAGIARIAALGDGALLDAAKLAARALDDGAAEEPLELVLVPCGAEPYRAVTRFAVIDDAGERPTVVDDRFGRASVVVVPEALELLPEATVARHALDSAVHAIESLLSRLANPYSRALASGALRSIAEETRARDATSAESRARLVVAAFLAAEAFSSTRLGLAHAVASPLGTHLGITHDALNAVLGESVVAFWGGQVAGLDDIAAALELDATPASVSSWLSALREAAGLPPSLRELDVPWSGVEAILPTAAKSSGISVLPRRLPGSGLARFARRGWAGVDEEVMNGGRP